MFKRKLNKAIAIVAAVATVATSALPASVYAAEFDNVVVVETEDTLEATEEVVEATDEIVDETEEVVEVVSEVIDDDQDTSEEVIDSQDEDVSEYALDEAELSQKTYDFSQLTKFSYGGYGYTEDVDADGKATLVIDGSYQEVFYAVPNDIKSYQVKQIVANLESGDVSTLSLRCRDDKGDEISAWSDVVAGKNAINTDGEFAAFCIANRSDEQQTYVISSLTFYIDETIEAPEGDEEGQKTYDFSQLTKFSYGGYGYTEEVDEDGKATLVIGGSYQEVFYAVPSNIDSKQIKKIVANLESGDASTLSLRCRDANGDEINAWSTSGLNNISPLGEFAALGIANKSSDEQTYVIASLTFYVDEIEEVNENERIYTFDKLTEAHSQNATGDVDENGVLTVEFVAQHGQVLYRIPEELDKETIKSVTWNLTKNSGRDGISVKILTEEDFNTENKGGDVAAVYGSNVATANEKGKEARYIAIMTTSKPSEANPIYMSFDSVKITIKEKGRNIKDNLLENYNSSFEDDGWWSDGSWSTDNLNTRKYTAEDPAPSTKVGEFYRRVMDPENTGSQDVNRDYPTIVMNQEIAGITVGGTYEFSFWARLDSDPEEVVDSSIKFGIQIHNVVDGKWTKSEDADITYDEDNKLTKEWKNFSGIIEIPEGTGLPEAMILFQTNDGVVFSIDDIRIGKTIIPHVQKNIPNFHEEVHKLGIKKSGVAISTNTLKDPIAMELVFKHFNSISCENSMKPEVILGSAPKYPVASVQDLDLHFEEADLTCDAIWNHDYVANESGELEKVDDIKMRGHVFVWHSQTPDWFFKEGFNSNGKYVSKAVMNERINDYIRLVAEHFDEKYPGLIYAWDVVNEQASDGSGIRMGTNWSAIYGGSDEYIIEAFKAADKYVAKDTILFYNDYNECTPSKRDQICKFLEKIRDNLSDGRKLGAGMQGHHDMASPDAQTIEAAVRAYAEIADVVHVTELDIKSTMGFRDDTQEAIAAEAIANGQRYRQIYNILEKVNNEYGGEKVECVTIWGTHDAVSWLKTSNNVGGSADGKTPQYPLIFDDNYQAKPAFWAIIDSEGKVFPEHKVDPLPTNVVIKKGISINSPEANWIELGEVEVTVGEETKTLDGRFLLARDEDNKYSFHMEAWGDLAGADTLKLILNGKEVEFETHSTMYDNSKVYTFDNVSGNTNGSDDTFELILKGDVDGLEIKFSAIIEDEPEPEIEVEPLDIERGTISVDGHVDTDWEDVEPTELTKASAEGLATGEVRYLWDDENLYVLMEVKDDTIDVSAGQAHEQDSIEIFIDENNHKTNSFEEDDKQYRVSATNVQSFNGQKCVADNIISEVVETETGYILEASIAWTDIEPADGTTIGLDIQINDGKNGKRTGTVNLYDGSGNGYQSTAGYGTAILKGEGIQGLSIQKIAPQTYTGKAIKPAVVVRYDGKKLVEGRDYTASYKNNIKASPIKGNGLDENFIPELPTVIITGKGNFSGSLKANFEIKRAPIDEAIFTYKDSAVETSSVTKPKVSVKYNSLAVPSNAYSVAYIDLSEEVPEGEGIATELTSIPANKPGAYKIIVEAKIDSNFRGRKELDYIVIPKTYKNVSKLTITIPKNADYTGGEVEPEVIVMDGKTILEKSDSENVKDYSVEYIDNVRPGTGKVVITGAGKYYGTVTKQFTINGKSVKKLSISLDKSSYEYNNGDAVKPVITVKDGTTPVVLASNELESGYSYILENNVMPGVATVTITGCGKYTGTVKKTFKINGTALSKLKIGLASNSVDYTGNNIEVGVTVTDGEDTLKTVKNAKENGIKVAYSNNKAPGTATITITGCGKYTGTVKKTFKINGIDFKSAIIEKPSSIPYKGKYYATLDGMEDFAVKYKVTTEKMAEQLNAEVGQIVELDSSNYTVSLVKGGLNAGEAIYSVSGKGIFSGSKNVKLVISKAEDAKLTMAAIDDISYGQSNNMPAVVVRFGSRILKSGTDYTVSYSNNTKVTEAAVAKVTLKGNYKGTLKGTYAIVPAEMDNETFSVTAQDVVANVNKGTYKSSIVVKNPSGKTLKAKVDYSTSIDYYIGSVLDNNLIKADTPMVNLVAGQMIYAVITGMGNYTGTLTTCYRLVDAKTSSVTIKISDKEYTGKVIELNPEDVTASVKVNGNIVNPVYGRDFTIEYLGDQKTTGKQQIVIVPISDGAEIILGGTKNATFKITPQKMNWSDAFLNLFDKVLDGGKIVFK